MSEISASGRGARLQHEALVNGLHAQSPLEIARVDEARLQPRRLREVLDAGQGGLGRVERQQLALAGCQRGADRMGAIERDDVGRRRAKRTGRMSGLRRRAPFLRLAISWRRAARHRSAAVFTHHSGCCARMARAARTAACGVAKRAKQVAPEPDMRASLQPRAARSSASASTMIGA